MVIVGIVDVGEDRAENFFTGKEYALVQSLSSDGASLLRFGKTNGRAICVDRTESED